MTSINTNASAMTALRTLQQTNKALDATQNRVSTGLKIGEAKDNAAYWAISTTLKADNKSLSTVKDALNLGAATVDTAYQGLNKAKEVLGEMQKKLTASTAAGVDRNVIQAELAELQKQLVSIASASTFSGENWLSVNSEAVDYNAIKNVVSSFAREANNAVTIGTIDVDISTFALFDSSTVANKNGILDGAVGLKGTDGRDIDLGTANTDGNTVTAGLTATVAGGVKGAAFVATPGTAVTATGAGLGTNATPTGAISTYTGSGVTVASGTPAAGDVVRVTFSEGSFVDVTPAAGSGVPTAAEIQAAVAAKTSITSFTASVSGGTNLVLTSTATGTGATAVTIASAAKQSGTGTGVYGASAAASTAGTAGTATNASVKSAVLTPADFAVGDKITVTLNIDGTDTTFTTAALTATTATDIAAALDTAFNGVADVAKDASTNALVFTAAATGLKSSFNLTRMTAVTAAGVAKTITNGIGTAPTSAQFETGSFQAVTLDADDNLYFKVQVDTATAAKNITINQALINKTLTALTPSTPVTDGKITTAAQFKAVIDAALAAAGVNNLTTTVTNTDKLTFSSTTTGASSMVLISDVKASAGADKITVDTIDISDAGLAAAGATTSPQIKALVQAYISVVNTALKGVTDAAANLGAVASRIDLQNTFVDTLMDTIDKGVSNLIDADLSEESTRLQALQTKQQLGVQALSIANASTQNILRLFQ